MSMLDVAIRRARAGHFPVNLPLPKLAPIPRVAVVITTHSRKPWLAPVVVEIEPPQVLPPTMSKRIKRLVCIRFNISMEELLGPNRLAVLARPRQIAQYLDKMLTRNSLPEIGRRFGGRDHTSILHSVRKITALRLTDPVLNTTLLELEAELQGAS